MNETSVSNNIQVSQALETNGAPFEDVINDTSFKQFDDISKHAAVANDTFYKVRCEEHCLRK